MWYSQKLQSLFCTSDSHKNLLWKLRKEFRRMVKKHEEHKLRQGTTTCNSFEPSSAFVLNCKYGDCDWCGSRSVCTANRETSLPSFLSWSTIIFTASLDGCFQRSYCWLEGVFTDSSPQTPHVRLPTDLHTDRVCLEKNAPDKHTRIIQTASVYW